MFLHIDANDHDLSIQGLTADRVKTKPWVWRIGSGEGWCFLRAQWPPLFFSGICLEWPGLLMELTFQDMGEMSRGTTITSLMLNECVFYLSLHCDLVFGKTIILDCFVFYRWSWTASRRPSVFLRSTMCTCRKIWGSSLHPTLSVSPYWASKTKWIRMRGKNQTFDSNIRMLIWVNKLKWQICK